jgi:imidazolonepropionase-like amidohydrolase
MGGETAGVDALRRAVRERAERGAGVVKVMASGGVMTPGTDLAACQFTLEELRALVDEAHRRGLPADRARARPGRGRAECRRGASTASSTAAA